MGEQRLIEITKEICKTSDPIWTMGYISTLGESDIYLLFKYIKASKHYGNMNIYDVIYSFACNYLISKDIPIPITNIEFISNSNSSSYGTDYFTNMIAGDDSMNFVGTGRSK